jgi:hypothetical protein
MSSVPASAPASVPALARARARAAAGLGLVAAAATVAGLWPAAGVPAWPGTMLGLGAVALALGPGPIGAKAVATVLGSSAALLGTLQIGALWAVAGALP